MIIIAAEETLKAGRRVTLQLGVITITTPAKT